MHFLQTDSKMLGREMGAKGLEESVSVAGSDGDVVVRIDVGRDLCGFDLKAVWIFGAGLRTDGDDFAVEDLFAAGRTERMG
jgi:hypothetical protein